MCNDVRGDCVGSMTNQNADVMERAARSSVGTRVGKQPTHSVNPLGSGSYCRWGLSTKSRPLDFYPWPDMSVMLT